MRYRLVLFLSLLNASSALLADDSDASASGETHWAYRPIVRTAPPVVQDEAWVRHAIDRFVLARLESRGVSPSETATRETLTRRVYLDILGLQPGESEWEQREHDTAPGWYERMVDRVLASPRFGERWGRHWLDLARYADSDGYEKDGVRPHAWRYRDWVIDRINEDQAFDAFSRDQLAGDLLSNATLEQRVATGFHRNTLHNTEGGADREEDRTKKTVDRVATTSAVWLGLTLACSQCHDHKYDELSQREFYEFFAFFNSLEERNIPAARPRDVEEFERRVAEHRAKVATQQTKLAALQSESGDQKSIESARQSLEALKKSAPKSPDIQAQTLAERDQLRPTFVHERGDFQRLGAKVHRGTPRVLPKLHSRNAVADRLDLANWLFDRENPLTARVAVNRIWGQLFGQGLVASNDDFGVRGEKPSHPQLLDWLASEYRNLAWSRKALLRTILLSATYRQSSRPRTDLHDKDPNNRWLARQSRLRVEAETIRDLALQAAGRLSTTIGGPSTRPPIPKGVASLGYANSVKWSTSKGDDRYRRGLYIFLQRTVLYPMLLQFDAPETTVACTRRARSNTPLQALTLLNDPVFVEAAQGLADRAQSDETHSDRDDRSRISIMFQRALSRPMTESEASTLLETLQRFRKTLRRDKQAATNESLAWFALARVLLNLDEFITRE